MTMHIKHSMNKFIIENIFSFISSKNIIINTCISINGILNIADIRCVLCQISSFTRILFVLIPIILFLLRNGKTILIIIKIPNTIIALIESQYTIIKFSTLITPLHLTFIPLYFDNKD